MNQQLFRMTPLLNGNTMKNRKSTVTRAVSALLLSLMLAACGGDSPESMLVSAKDYLAKNDSKAAVIQLKNALQKTVPAGSFVHWRWGPCATASK